MRNLNELNINEGGRLVARSAPLVADIKSFEASFGIRLPKSYITFLNHSNGGHPELDTFAPIKGDNGNTWAVNRFYFLDSDHSTSGGLWQVQNDWKDVLGPKSVPIASDSGGNQIVLDFNSCEDGEVKLCIHDRAFKMISIAPSFDSFINLLSEDPDMI